jgi:hypothetical protein
MGRADLATTLGVSRSTAHGASEFGALVSRTSPTQRSNRPTIAR